MSFEPGDVIIDRGLKGPNFGSEGLIGVFSHKVGEIFGAGGDIRRRTSIVRGGADRISATAPITASSTPEKTTTKSRQNMWLGNCRERDSGA